MASLGIALVRDLVFGGRPGDRAHVIGLYEANVAAVEATVLVHELGDGWGPLGAHLGVAVPEAAYPSRNSTTEFQRAILGAGGK